jgi:hypothetical protein
LGSKLFGREILKLYPKLGCSLEPLDSGKLSLNLLQVLQAVVVLNSAETQNSFSLLVAARVFTILHFNQGSFGNSVEKAPSLFSVEIASNG